MTDNENIELEDSPEEEIQEASAEVDQPDEKKSEQSVAAAQKGGKVAPKRSAAGGASDNTTQDPMPKTKGGMLNAMYLKASKMNKADLTKAYTAMHGTNESVEEEDFVDADDIEIQNNDFSQDIDALVESEATLSAEFKTKAATIFEAALKSKLSEEIDLIEEQYKTELSEEIAATKAELVEKVDNYLNYVVENWMEENKLAIQGGLRTEIAEGFMNSLKGLFEESYIEVPESKVDLVDDLSSQVDELEEQLNKQTEQAIEQSAELEELKRDNIVREHSNDLAETQVEKLKKLAEDIDFVNEETFSEKVKTIKESYFKKSTQSVSEEDNPSENEAPALDASDPMAKYLEAIRKTEK